MFAVAVLAVVASALADDDDGAAHLRGHARQSAISSELLGRSVQGRPIRALVLGDPNAPTTALVVGCIHGNEPAGMAVVARLRHWHPPAGMAVWVVRDINPDGVAAGTRQNARG